jgi:hypothetical protein
MKRRKLYFLVVILSIVFLFGTAAICNQCAIVPAVTTGNTSAEETTGKDQVEETVAAAEETVGEETAAAEETTTESEEVAEETEAEETEVEEIETEETEEEVIGEGSGVVFTPAVNKNLSGYIVKDGPVTTRVVMIGDIASNKDTKGYISFNISELMDSPIVSAELKISNIVAALDPTFAEQMNIKYYDYGDSLDISDFAVGGDFLASIPTAGLTNINISDNNLKNLIKKSIEAGKDYFQLKLGLSTSTDNDNTADLFAINLDNAKLTVEQ